MAKVGRPGISSAARIVEKELGTSGVGVDDISKGLVSGDTATAMELSDLQLGDSDMVALTVDDAENYGPAYGLGSERGGPHCSSCDDFCFFCSFSDGGSAPGQTGGSIITDLKTMVRQLASERKEVDTIVDAVYAAYEEHARADVEFVDSAGKTVVAPEWMHRSIKRHLLFSREFEELFDHSVDNIFHATIFHLNAKMVHRDTHTIEPKTHKMLLDTIASYRMWRKAFPKNGGPSSSGD